MLETAPLAGLQRIGPYQILMPLGSGGMGEVYRAKDTKLGREVALKLLPRGATNVPEMHARFAHEAQVLASLNHPNIAAIYGMEEEGDVCCLVLELIEGETLAERIVGGPLSIDESLEIGAQIATGLSIAHGHGIVHRDLKPHNVMVTPHGVAKLVDFGIAKAIDPDALASAPAGVTSPGTLIGTIPYMSPEQILGRNLDRRTDLWSFACLLYEMLSGRLPFEADTRAEMIAAILDKPPNLSDLPPEVPRVVRELLIRCLQKDPDDRIADITEASEVIEKALMHLRREPAPIGRPAALLAAGAVGLVVAFASMGGDVPRELLRVASERAGSLIRPGLLFATALSAAAALVLVGSLRQRGLGLGRRLAAACASRAGRTGIGAAGALLLSVAGYAAVDWWLARAAELENEALDVYIVLPFQKLNDEHPDELLDVSEHFRATLAAVFTGLDSVRVLPDVFVSERFNTHAPECSMIRVADWIQEKRLRPDIVLCSTVDLFDDTAAHSGVVMVSTVNRVRDGVLEPIEGRFRQAGTYDDIRWMALRASAHLLELLVEDPQLRLSSADQARVEHRLLERFDAFLAFRPSSGNELAAQVAAALKSDSLSIDEVTSFLDGYTSPVDMVRYARHQQSERAAALSRPIAGGSAP